MDAVTEVEPFVSAIQAKGGTLLSPLFEGLKPSVLLLKVIMPAAAPLIASGVQVAISLALVVTVSVELVSGSGGLGTFVLQAQQGNGVPTMYAGILVGGLVGWALNTGFAWLMRLGLPWSNRLENE